MKQSNILRGYQVRFLALAVAVVSAIALAGAVYSGTAFAAITNVGGDAIQIAPPASVEPGMLVGPDIYAFDERQNVLVPNAHACDIGAIPAGAVVDSHYIHFDPAGFATAQGGVQFDGQVICVITSQALLDASNGLLGWPGTVYPNAAMCVMGGVHCGTEPTDMIQVGPNWVRVSFDALDPGDRVRVVTSEEEED